MEYVIPLVLVAAVICAAIVMLVNRATAKRSASARDESGGPGIGPDSATPFGDTPEHAGVQTEEGKTVAGQDAKVHGAGRFVHHEDAEHVKAEGEAEGSSRIK